ncbi:MAG: carboxypeptidase regulatory-like domain-containing protein [Myxococcales bacterium]|nr:carboxypeptidase regulatory-like domain-containing protein [Myxococcales bacterium]MCB9521037.1 carboxypeptidase regulatory-like domain-containing protein [Myxococcales bacterium]
MMRRAAIVVVLGLTAAACISAPSAPEQWEAAVSITSTPSGAQVVWIRPATPSTPGGLVELGRTPMTWTASRAQLLDAAEAELVFFVEGHGRARSTIAVDALRAGTPVDVAIPQFATLRVRTAPVAAFTVVDATGTAAVRDEYAPFQVGDLSPGEYTVTAHRDGFDDSVEHVTLRAGEAGAVSLTLAQQQSSPLGEPRMAVFEGEIAPELDEVGFMTALRAQHTAIAACYDRVLAADPSAGGCVVLQLEVNLGFGRIDEARIVESDITHADTVDCIQRRIRRVELPTGEPGTAVANVTLQYFRLPAH